MHMYYVRLIGSAQDVRRYNAIAPHPLQSWEWGIAREKTGVAVIRVGEFDKETLVNVFQMTMHPIPYTPYYIGYIPRSKLPSKEVLSFLTKYGREHNIIYIKWEPNIYEQSLQQKEKEMLDMLCPSPHPLFPVWTQVLDLTPSEDELLQKMKPKTRYNIRLAQRKGVSVREMSNDEGLETFISLYFDTCRRQHYYGHTPAYHRTTWESTRSSMGHILIAYHEDKPLAAYELFLFHNVWYYPYGGSSPEYRNIMAPNLLMWEAIRLGKHLGAASFDMWGSDSPYGNDPSYAGFTRFKEGYGTKYMKMVGSLDLVIKPALYSIYNIAHIIRSQIMKYA